MNAHKYTQTLIGVLERIMGIETKRTLASEVYLSFKTEHLGAELKFSACTFMIIKNYFSSLHMGLIAFSTCYLPETQGTAIILSSSLLFSPEKEYFKCG